MDDAAIETRALGKTYPGGVRALDEVSFRTAYGEALAYLGRNGSGKTTTIRILTTLSAATTGTARVGGHDVARSPELVRRAIGVTMQHAALDETMTGRELLAFLAALWELPRGTARARIGEVVDSFGLGAVLDRRIATYSGGTRRRLDLAGALLHKPQVLFLDEPSTGLDPQSRRTLWAQVRELRDQGSAILLTTQYLEEAAELADRIAILQAGRLVAQDTPAGLRRRHGGLRLRVRLDTGPSAPGWGGNGHGPDQRGWITRPVASVDQAYRALAELAGDGVPLAVLAIAVLLAGWTLGYAGLYYLVGLRARSPEALTALVPLFLPISLLSTAYVPAELLPGWVRAAAAVNPYSHVVDAVRAAMAGTLGTGRLAAGLAAVAAAVALTQLAAARRFTRLVHRD